MPASRLPAIRRLAASWLVASLAVGAAAAGPERGPQGDLPHFVVFTETYGFRHDGIAEAAATLHQLSRTDGGFTIEVTDDPAVFAPETYARVDGLILPNITGLGGESSPLTDQQRSDLLAFVSGGGAVVGVHATADTGGGWPEFDELLGSYGFDQHPHLSLEARDNPAGRGAFNPAFLTDVVIQVEQPEHVTTTPWQGFDSFRITDEIYRWQGDPREDEALTVVLSLDEESHYWRSEIGTPAAGGMAPPIPNPIPNPLNSTPLGFPEDSPVAWVKTHGQGAVFYTNLGHNMATWERADFQEHLVQGIRWVIGATA